MTVEVAALLAPLWDDPSGAGIFCDFDGTLASIVDDPEEARPVDRAVAVLDALARRYARVGVVSGRPLSFLEGQLGDHGLILSGLYGLETRRDGELVPNPEVERWRPVVDDVVGRDREDAAARLRIEGKGLSVAVHFRTAPDLAGVAREWADAEADRTGLAVHEGRMSYELRPPVETSKGSSVATMAEGLGAVCFIGDDVGDVPAFEALDELARSGTHAVRVAVRSEESPAELIRRADLVVDGPDGVVDLLERLERGN